MMRTTSALAILGLVKAFPDPYNKNYHCRSDADCNPTEGACAQLVGLVDVEGVEVMKHLKTCTVKTNCGLTLDWRLDDPWGLPSAKMLTNCGDDVVQQPYDRCDLEGLTTKCRYDTACNGPMTTVDEDGQNDVLTMCVPYKECNAVPTWTITGGSKAGTKVDRTAAICTPSPMKGKEGDHCTDNYECAQPELSCLNYTTTNDDDIT